MVSVMRLAAIGAITLHKMLYLMPSLASVSVKPTWASLAAAGCQSNRGFTPALQMGALTRVICLTKVAKQASSRRCVDNATVLLFPEVWPCCPGALIGALDVDLEDQVPVLVLDILEADISQDAGVVDEDVNTAKRLYRSVDNLVTVLYGVVVCDGLSAGLLYLIDDDIGGLVREKRSATGVERQLLGNSLLRSFLRP